jgi:hypothetical protein
MPSTDRHLEAFGVMECTILARTTGHEVQSLRELRDALLEVETASIYYHFWGGLLRPTFDDPEYPNDFALWVGRELRDPALAERLAMVDPVSQPTIEDLREELVELCDDRLDGLDQPLWVGRDRKFNFLAAHIAIMPTGRVILDPEDLPDVLPRLSRNSIFYHFVDARRRREDGLDDLRAWLAGDETGRYEPISDRLAGLDPFQGSLLQLKQQVVEAVRGGLAEVTS